MVVAAVCAYACLACFIGVLGVLAFPSLSADNFPGDIILTTLPKHSLLSITGQVSLALVRQLRHRFGPFLTCRFASCHPHAPCAMLYLVQNIAGC